MGYTGFERLWLFFAFSFFGWVLETAMAAVRQKKARKQRTCERAALCDLWYYGNSAAGRMPGTAWNLAVSWQYDLFDTGRVDRRSCDRENVPRAVVGLLRYYMAILTDISVCRCPFSGGLW